MKEKDIIEGCRYRIDINDNEMGFHLHGDGVCSSNRSCGLCSFKMEGTGYTYGVPSEYVTCVDERFEAMEKIACEELGIDNLKDDSIASVTKIRAALLKAYDKGFEKALDGLAEDEAGENL